uniref:Integrin subunit alpha 3 n=1 Tax=Zosterops lateralis melanops TaxID=1220523 RepID=A0A8D2PVQ7_ZOSLA
TPQLFWGREGPRGLLVGAPQDTEPVNGTRTGAVYSCPLSATTRDCQRLAIEIKDEPDKAIIEDMWLGVTVASQRQPPGRVLACAHRYTRVLWSGAEAQRRMVGRCYVRGNDLSLDLGDEWQTYHNEMCNANTDTDETGMCQMGASAGFGANIIYFGAPGAYNWQGTDYVLQREMWDLHDFSYPNKRNGNIYIGYSAQVSHAVLQQAAVTVVTGAPRKLGGLGWTLGVSGEVWGVDCPVIPPVHPSFPCWGESVGSHRKLGGLGWTLGVSQEIEGSGLEFGGPRAGLTLFLPALSPDIAVGAPFEGPGKVYIYHGSARGLRDRPRQVISGSELGPTLIPTFGYSLSGGLDVDGNSYPDLLVGSLSDHIVLLRARPVINILDKTFTVTPSKVDPAQCTPKSCMTVTLCFSYNQSAGDPKYNERITLQYTLEADKDRHPPRVRFWGSQSATFTGEFSMPETRCQTQELLLVDNVRDKLHPIVLSMNYSLLERPRTFRLGPHSLDPFPVLNQDQPHHNETKIEFQKECGSDNQCYSNLQLQSSFVTEQNQPLPRCHPAVPLSLCHPALSPLCPLQSLQCPLHSPFVSPPIPLCPLQCPLCVLPSPLCLVPSVSPPVSLLCPLCPLQSLCVLASSHLQSYFSGAVVGESAMRHEQDVGSALAFDFQVTTKGESLGSLGSILLGFEWPYEIPNGKWLLYPTEILVNNNGSCHPPGGLINPLNLSLLQDQSPARHRRDLEPPEPGDPPVTLATGRRPRSEAVLSCSGGTARCVWFECPLENTELPSSFSLRARVWNSTFIEEFRDFDRVKVTGTATLFLRSQVPTISMRNHTVRFSVDVDSELQEEQPAPISLWLVLVSVAAGLLLLGLIILLLWKVRGVPNPQIPFPGSGGPKYPARGPKSSSWGPKIPKSPARGP